jgi:F-type H+-transporting ATPase subunit alpha
MKSVAGTLKIDLAQFRELESFATFGSELDKASARQLERGYRLTELLKQNLNSPMAVENQVAVIAAGTGGHLDDIPVEDVKRFEADLLVHLETGHSGLLAHIRDQGTLPDDAALDAAIADFAEQFEPTEDEKADEPDAEAQGEAESGMAGGRAEATLPEEEISRAATDADEDA